MFRSVEAAPLSVKKQKNSQIGVGIETALLLCQQLDPEANKKAGSSEDRGDGPRSSSTSSHMDHANCVSRQPFPPIRWELVEVL